MKLITIGDSITRGSHIDDNGEWAVAQPNYSKILQTLLGANELLCLGVNGVSISATSHTNPQTALSKLCEKAVDGDIVVVAGGTNDFGTSVEVGNENDREDISTYGALHILFTRLKALNPKAEIYAVLPIPRRNENVKNERGYILDDYRAAIKTVAKRFNVAVIDGKRLPINPEDETNRQAYIRDGLHPNTKCHAIYGKFIYNEIMRIKG